MKHSASATRSSAISIYMHQHVSKTFSKTHWQTTHSILGWLSYMALNDRLVNLWAVLLFERSWLFSGPRLFIYKTLAQRITQCGPVCLILYQYETKFSEAWRNRLHMLVHIFSRYPQQCWRIIKDVLWHSSENNYIGNAQDIYPWYDMSLKHIDLGYSYISQGPMS